MNHYVTLFDSNFLPQGLALYESMIRHAGPFTLWILCIDKKVKNILEQLDKPGMRLIELSEIETDQLKYIKQQRTRVEYCWTLTPLTPKVVFERDSSVNRVTYLDADMFFLKDPDPIHKEFQESKKSVLITDHAFDVENDRSASSGRYCVQFMTFVRDNSEAVRAWWEKRCIEWCFAKSENGKFGDQKYLDDWPSRFPNDVHVLRQFHLLLGPWNTKRFHYSQGVAWHFHGLRLLEGGRVLTHPGYSVPGEVDVNIYAPYVKTLRRAVNETGEPIVQQYTGNRFSIIPPWLKGLIRRGFKFARDLRPREASMP